MRETLLWMAVAVICVLMPLFSHNGRRAKPSVLWPLLFVVGVLVYWIVYQMIFGAQ